MLCGTRWNFLTQYNYVTGIGFPWQQLLRRTLVLLFFMAAVRSDTGFIMSAAL